MSETNAEAKTENNVEAPEKGEPTPRKGKRTSSIASKLAKEAESLLKGFGDKEDAPEGRRTTRSSTRGSVAPPVCTPPPAKKERKSSASLNNSTSGPRRGRPKKGASDEVKPNNEEVKEEANDVDKTTDVNETSKANDVADVEMKEENVADVDSGSSGDVVAPSTDGDEADVGEAKTETTSEDSRKELTVTSPGDGNEKSNETSSAVSSSSTASSVAVVASNSSVASAVPNVASVAITSNVSSVSVASTTTANGTVENTCKRINRDDKQVNDSTGAVDGDDVALNASLALNEEKAATASVGEKTTTGSPFSDESNKSLNNSSEPLANQASVTLSSND